MKRKLLLVYAIYLVLANHIDVNASSYADEWLAKKQQQQEEYMNELAKDGNLTQEAIDSISKGKSNRKPNKKTNKSKNQDNKKNTNGKTTLIYGTDELHVVGLPTNEEGYTKAGKYER